MAESDPLERARNAHQEVGKNLALMITAYRETARALQACSPIADGPITDAHLRIGDNPKRVLFTIDGPIPTMNLDLKKYMGTDRFVWASLREWWDGQIANAIRLEGDCPAFARAHVAIIVSSGADLDSIGVKAVLDALVHNKVIADDSPKVLQYLSVCYAGSDYSKIQVCVYEPDGETEAAIRTILKRADLPQGTRPEIAKTSDWGSFFGPQKL